MNFFSHASVAAWHSDEPGFLFGAMVPDLVGMVGARVARVLDPMVSAGIDHHHATDAAFHAAPVFTELCAQTIATLSQAGVARGTARATAHVGIELLLDGVLSSDHAACIRYRHALRQASERPIEESLVLVREEDHARLQRGLARLQDAPLPEGYREANFVTDRLQHILSHRPRLAMRKEDLGAVRDVIQTLQPQVTARHQQLLDEVRAGLSRAERPALTAVIPQA